MKKIKMLVAAAFVCAVGFTSYTAYDKATMTDAERMMQANIDALSEEVLTESNLTSCSGGCNTISWGTKQILKCDCSYTGWFSDCKSWGCDMS